MTSARSNAFLAFGMMTIALLTVARAQEVPPDFDDHQNMMDQLGVRALRPGANPREQAKASEATANPFKDSLPDALKLKDGRRVTRDDQWPARRAEIVEDFAREVYGRIPAAVPRVTWEVRSTERARSAGVETITKHLVGRVDNSAYPKLSVNIDASFTVPANATAPVPIMISLDRGFRKRTDTTTTTTSTRTAASPSIPPAPAWQALAISKGWGYGSIDPQSVQPDNNKLTTGIIGLTNKGQPRKPDQWGAIRAWQWGFSRLIDYFEANPNSKADPKKVGVEGLSRYGKAAVVTLAFDERVAVGLIASSGEGGTKLHRHVFGEAVENLSGGLYYWMAGNFIKYGASDPKMTAADLPVDSHELIALCAPRPCFISHGVPEKGDGNWIDARGSFMSAVLASPVYELLGARGLGVTEDYLTAQPPPVGQRIGGDLAWRQHEGGHDVNPNWPAFFEWVGAYVK